MRRCVSNKSVLPVNRPENLPWLLSKSFRFQFKSVWSKPLQANDCERTADVLVFHMYLVANSGLKIEVGRDQSAVEGLHVELAPAAMRTRILRALTLEPEAVDVSPVPTEQAPVERVDATPDALILRTSKRVNE